MKLALLIILLWLFWVLYAPRYVGECYETYQDGQLIQVRKCQ